MEGPSSIASKPMPAQDGVMSPYTKFHASTSMHRRDIDLLPVWGQNCLEFRHET